MLPVGATVCRVPDGEDGQFLAQALQGLLLLRRRLVACTVPQGARQSFDEREFFVGGQSI